MGRAYPLYFDRQLPDIDRCARRIAAIMIVVLHIIALSWFASSPRGKQVLDAASRLVVIDLGDGPSRTLAKSPPSPRLAASNRLSPSREPIASSSTGHTQSSSTRTYVAPASAPSSDLAATANTGAAADAAGSVTSGRGTDNSRYRFRPPRTLHSWLPPYPEDAFRGNHQGAVDLLVTIDAEGKLVAAHVDRSSGNVSLDRAALESLDRYTFRAAERDGVPVRADAIVTINWIITPTVVRQVSAAQIERIDLSNLTHQRKQTQFGSYLQGLQRERDNDTDRQ